MFVRVVNALLGLWLFVSAFMFPHLRAQFFNELISSILVTAFALMSILGRGDARKLNFLVGVWLFISALALPHPPGGSVVNQLLVAVLVVITALFPSRAHFEGTRTVA